MIEERLQEILGGKIISIQPLSGGDIALAQRVDTQQGRFFIKSASFTNAKELFEKELIGLRTLEKSKAIGTPKAMGTYPLKEGYCLVLEFIETKRADPHNMELFGRQLAHLHLSVNTNFFGFESDNFIGKLPQKNQKHDDWCVFYVEQRLIPQLEMAQSRGLLNLSQVPKVEMLLKRCSELFGDVRPALLHGDLWSGNYLISNSGVPFLIDPAIYYGHNEVDLAMAKLFGGFSNTFYGAYHEIIPPHHNQKELIDVYQLYYLLVHLNLFGTSYLGSVVRILRRYFA